MNEGCCCCYLEDSDCEGVYLVGVSSGENSVHERRSLSPSCDKMINFSFLGMLGVTVRNSNAAIGGGSLTGAPRYDANFLF